MKGHVPIILAGGLGTRLAGTIPGLPKVLVPVLGRPFLTFLFDRLIAAGFGRVVLSVGFRSAQVEAAFGARYHNLYLHYVAESEPLGTGGALRLAAEATEDESCLVLNGDSYCDVDLLDFLCWREERPEPVAMVLAEVPDVARYGSVDLAANGRIVRFREKATRTGAGWINAGIYSVPTATVRTLPVHHRCSLEHEAFPEWLASGMVGYMAGRTFIDIGTPESYAAAEAFFLSGHP